MKNLDAELAAMDGAVLNNVRQFTKLRAATPTGELEAMIDRLTLKSQRILSRQPTSHAEIERELLHRLAILGASLVQTKFLEQDIRRRNWEES